MQKKDGLPKGMLFRVGLDFPDVFVHLDKVAINPAEERGKKEDKSVTDSVAPIHYKEKKSQDDYMDRYKEVKTVDGN